MRFFLRKLFRAYIQKVRWDFPAQLQKGKIKSTLRLKRAFSFKLFACAGVVGEDYIISAEGEGDYVLIFKYYDLAGRRSKFLVHSVIILSLQRDRR